MKPVHFDALLAMSREQKQSPRDDFEKRILALGWASHREMFATMMAVGAVLESEKPSPP